MCVHLSFEFTESTNIEQKSQVLKPFFPEPPIYQVQHQDIYRHHHTPSSIIPFYRYAK